MTIRVGVSACLIGHPVRFDGGHKRDRFIVDELGQFVDLVPVCPEVGAGMGTPRPAVRLVGLGAPRMLDPRTGHDWTDAVQAFSERELARLEALDLCGFVLKRASPTCGMERVRVYDERGMPHKTGTGVFARALMEAFPLLPIEEEGRLNDPLLRETFVEAVFGYARLRALESGQVTRGDLVDFHSRNKYLLLAHSPAHYRELGRVVARQKQIGAEAALERYRRGYMEAMRARPTVSRHVNVLQHLAGYVRGRVDDGDRVELHGTIADYAGGLVPLSVPLMLVSHYVRALELDYLARQTYLAPAPKQLRLRSHL